MSDVAASARRKAYLNVVLPLFLISVIAYIDRVNIGYAALTMNQDLGFDARVFGLGAGVFFAGYFLFEIPGALIAERYSPRLLLARIMISWGLVSALMAFMQTAWQFYLLRFLLGAAEASLYLSLALAGLLILTLRREHRDVSTTRVGSREQVDNSREAWVPR